MYLNRNIILIRYLMTESIAFNYISIVINTECVQKYVQLLFTRTSNDTIALLACVKA